MDGENKKDDFGPNNDQSNKRLTNNESEGFKTNQQEVGDIKNKGGHMGSASSGGSLEYIDDNFTSYSSIFDNVVVRESKENYNKVIKDIKTLNEGEDIESYWNVDEILIYLEVHIVVVNLDSYSSSMA